MLPPLRSTAATGAASRALDITRSDGLPTDERFVDDSAFRQGRTALMIMADVQPRVMWRAAPVWAPGGNRGCGPAEMGDLSDVETHHHGGGKHHAEGGSETYQKSVVAGLQPEAFARSYDTAPDDWDHHDRDADRDPDFRRGDEQGRHDGEHIQEKWRQAA